MKSITLIFLSLLVIISIFIYPNATLALGGVALLASLAFVVHIIIQKHKGKPNAYKNILQEIGVFVATLLLAILFGSLAGTFVNGYVSNLFGAIVGLIMGLVTAFMVGYVVKRGVDKFINQFTPPTSSTQPRQ